MSNFSILVFMFCLLGIVGCVGEENAPVQKSIVKEEAILVPKFRIEVSLTEEAIQKLKQSKESMKGAIYFDGDGTSLPGVKTAPFRDVFLGNYDFELRKEGIDIEDASISKEAYSRLKDENYHYFVNVYSGRRVFKNNILDCDYVDGRFQNLKSGEVIKIICRLL